MWSLLPSSALLLWYCRRAAKVVRPITPRIELLLRKPNRAQDPVRPDLNISYLQRTRTAGALRPKYLRKRHGLLFVEFRPAILARVQREMHADLRPESHANHHH